MTKNTKIALGCGGAGCLGIILVVIIAVVAATMGYLSLPGISSTNRNYNYNYNANRNSNTNYNSSSNINTNTNSSSSSSTLSNDDKHKLFQAAYATKDNQAVMRMFDKIGFPNAQGDGLTQFTEEHVAWAMRNFDFMQEVNTTAKARAYFDAHIDD